MRNLLLGLSMLTSVSASAFAVDESFTGGGAIETPSVYHGELDREFLSREIGSALVALGLEQQAIDGANAYSRETAQRLRFPLRAASNYHGIENHTTVNFVDLDATIGQVQDYACGARSYDTAGGYNHEGTDFTNVPFWWDMMDEDSTHVVAAAGGIILFKFDGEYDRECSINGRQGNLIVLLQDDGLAAVYRHLKSGSLTDVAVGERVEAGDFLGVVGSSGSSTVPHLHFELQVYDPQNPGSGQIVDPFEGACGESSSLWQHQPSYYDPAIVSLRTHSFIPNVNTTVNCAPNTENPADFFAPGQMAYWAVYLRNQRPTELVELTIFRPDGSQFDQWTLGTTLTGFAPFSYWYANRQIPLDAPEGMWTMQAEFDGRVVQQGFMVGAPFPDTNAQLLSAVLPASRSVRAGTPATIFTTILNAGTQQAQGCAIRPAQPFDGGFEFVETSPLDNTIIGSPNALFDLDGGGARSFLITLTPDSAAEARSFDMTFRYICANADAAPITSGLNTLLMSFEDASIPDVVSIALTPTNDGILSIDGPGSAQAFAMATANVGSAETLTIRTRMTGVSSGAATVTACVTNPASGACTSPISGELQHAFGAGGNQTFAFFVSAIEAIPFSPATTRLFVEVVDTEGVVRGSTSVALRTD